ncbi:chorismate-binding protein [Gordonia sp. NB41Y]|uniref:isochorismate synthase n=1 Tax=Gordonia sp. NB41Y TaxID=875808 RepID=UPI0006B1628F|nr:chorismate-binding protein [Gordonia sp. NB41Y]WLP90903.1 chorismate-binding protein [Gordonia sp. NB41Y]
MKSPIVAPADTHATASPAARPGHTTPDDLDGFLFCRNDYHVLCTGRHTVFDDPADACAALRDGSVDAVVGALPFDPRDPVALTAPQRWVKNTGPWLPTTDGGSPAARIERRDPEPEDHRRRVAAAVERLADPAGELQKVVLARALRLRTESAMTPWELAARLRTLDPRGSVFVTDLSPAPGHGGAHLVGASPEVLIRKSGSLVTAHPLAGSAARHPDPVVDAERGRALAVSKKDLDEHRYVVDALRSSLAPLCAELDIPDEPVIMSTPSMWHLGTPIRATVADASVTALDLAIAVHPTPAICGTPTVPARDHILATEGSRGFYAGAVGWSESASAGGDGEWMVSIRCAEVAADGEITTWAGGGIVAQSDPAAEVAETEAKFAAILSAFSLR